MPSNRWKTFAFEAYPDHHLLRTEKLALSQEKNYALTWAFFFSVLVCSTSMSSPKSKSSHDVEVESVFLKLRAGSVWTEKAVRAEIFGLRPWFRSCSASSFVIPNGRTSLWKLSTCNFIIAMVSLMLPKVLKRYPQGHWTFRIFLKKFPSNRFNGVYVH